MKRAAALAACLGCAAAEPAEVAAPPAALRVMVELGADPGARASLERLLHYTGPLHIAGLVLADEDREVRRIVAAAPGARPRVAVAEDGVARVEAAIGEAGPLWFLRWSAERPGRPSSLRRALDRLQARGPEARYREALARLRVVGPTDGLEPHGRALGLCIDTGDWADEAAAILSRGARETGSIMFLHLLPAGPGVAEHPEWGGWGGRFAPHRNAWAGWWEATAEDAWNGARTRSNTLLRWMAGVENDHAARVVGSTNRPPEALVAGHGAGAPVTVRVAPGDRVTLDAGGSYDPDGGPVRHEWIPYPEAGTYPNEIGVGEPDAPRLELEIPFDFAENRTFHLVLAVTDAGSPPLTRHRRVVLHHY